ncbi:MAG: nickel pincer cofactor biosynthesis protein LarC [Eubacteriaceae bacterium]
MEILYFDCFSGISGDMFLGAMIDVGISEQYLITELKKLNLDGYDLEIFRDKKKGISGTKVNVLVKEYDKKLKSRNYSFIKELINNSGLNEQTKNLSKKIFNEIALAESKIHNKNIEEIHFHEVGSMDSIIDVVGAAICIDYLKPERIIFSNIVVGKGYVNCAHGLLPVPAPATAEILRGIPISQGTIEKEMTTPTGAAIVKVLADEICIIEDFIIEKIGYGLGKRDNDIPNVLRVCTGKQGKIKPICKKIECNIDDGNPEILPYVVEKLLEAGAMDAWITPMIMKKGRPAITLSVLCIGTLTEKMEEIIINETSTIGLRSYPVEKLELDRKVEKLNTPYGDVNIKIAMKGGVEIKYKPEFEDCKSIAKNNNMSLEKVYNIINDCYKSLYEGD